LRNGVLLSIAPTGTISTAFGDVSSGCEPTFAHKQIRKIKVKNASHDDTWQPYDSYSYTVRFYAHVHGISNEEAYKVIRSRPEIFPTAGMLSVQEHIAMQGVLQRYVDSSISKTTNVPTDMPFNDFIQVYDMAWKAGCKGTTTYRPSETRGAVLIDADAKIESAAPKEIAEPPRQPHGSAPSVAEGATVLGVGYKRPDMLSGKTFKLRWPHLVSPVFLTINSLEDGRPVELFISSKDASHHEWTIALSVFASKLLQMGATAHYVADQLKSITLSHAPAWVGGKHYGSLVAWVGAILESLNGQEKPLQLAAPIKTEEQPTPSYGKRCNRCGSVNVEVKEGCLSCNDCNHSNCH
jgi:ribonucleoside-diphosphate reductase alpha chain